MQMYQPLIDQFEEYLNEWTPQISSSYPDSLNRLVESVQYSLKNGGKRFRPLLSLLTAETLETSVQKVLPVAYAVECIHTYSLIHDDLPVMDDDDVRRGQPTNHKVFGEAMALLAGDALLTESLGHLCKAYREAPAVAAESTLLISEAAGWRGMVGGQSVDIEKNEELKKTWIEFIHENKTGALIRVSVEAAAVACGASSSQRKSLTEFAKNLGFAFQLADDLLDWDPERPENTSYVNIYGENITKQKLQEVSSACLEILKQSQLSTRFFEPLIKYNIDREN